MRSILVFCLFLFLYGGLHGQQATKPAKSGSSRSSQVFEGLNGEKMDKVVKSEEEWKKILSEQEFYVLRKAGTERAFTGQYYKHKGEGTYTCRGCGLPLFSSTTKYESGCGWPSFFMPLKNNNVKEVEDNSLGMSRIEVLCARCGGHRGHVFDVGPTPTGLRYCMNSVSLNFVPKK